MLLLLVGNAFHLTQLGHSYLPVGHSPFFITLSVPPWLLMQRQCRKDSPRRGHLTSEQALCLVMTWYHLNPVRYCHSLCDGIGSTVPLAVDPADPSFCFVELSAIDKHNIS